MSKSKGNVEGPDTLAERYGADAVRLYIMFLGPADQDKEWTEEGIEGLARFLRRLWRLGLEVAERAPRGETGDGPVARAAHRAIAEVSRDIEQFKFNTGISEVMKLVNEIAPDPGGADARFAMETAVSLIQPYAPHIAEELWERLGRTRLWEEPWPKADPAMLESDTFELVVQVNGRVRDRLQVPSGLPEEELVERAKSSPRVQTYLDGDEAVRDVIVVPGKLVNLVVG
jgi:leucyl-tRNA synthetase